VRVGDHTDGRHGGYHSSFVRGTARKARRAASTGPSLRQSGWLQSADPVETLL
jgi:hypothetical protein